LITQISEEYYFTAGRVLVQGKTVKRGVRKRADYLLLYKPNLPLAVIEAKDNNHSVGASRRKLPPMNAKFRNALKALRKSIFHMFYA